MNSLGDLPQRSRSHNTADKSETAFHASIEDVGLFVIQQKDRTDYGTDVQIEACDSNEMTNFRVHVQLKGTTSASNDNGSISVSVPRTNLNYLLNQPNSLYVCYHLPTERLLVRYAEDVYRAYEHRGENWLEQETVTVNFSQSFDEEFQRLLHARLIAFNRSTTDQRLQWVRTPPEHIPSLIQGETRDIIVPAEPGQAQAMLTELYNAGKDSVISKSFAQFEAVLGSVPGAMDEAYMAEINLGVNGQSFDETRTRESINVFKEAMQRGNIHTGSLLYCIGNARLALKEYEKAEGTYRRALTMLNDAEPNRTTAMCNKNLGSALEALGEIEEARACYEEALTLVPDLSEARFSLALWHYKHGDDAHVALAHLDHVVRREDSALRMSVVQGWRINLLFNTGDSTGAFREINNLIGQENLPDWVWPWCAKNIARFGKTSTETAQKSLRFWLVYLRKHPEDAAAERERLLCLWRLRADGSPTETNFNEFRSAIMTLIENGDPNPAFLWDRIGHWAQYDENWAEAEEAYRRAYELNPERYGYCLGVALILQDRYEEALPLVLEAATLHQPDALSWFQVATCLDRTGRIDEAINAYEKAVTLDQEYALAWFDWGGALWNAGQHEEARAVWLEALSHFPEHELAERARRFL